MKNLTPFLALPLTLLAAILVSAAALPTPPTAPIPPMPFVAGPEVPDEHLLAKAVDTARPDKDGRILVPAFTVANARWTTGANGANSLTLDAPAAPYPLPDTTMAAYIEADIFVDNSALHSKAEVVLTPAVVAGLRDLGIKDPLAHFKNRILQVRGVRPGGFKVAILPRNAGYTTTVTVDRLEDIKVTDAPANTDSPAKN